MKADERPIRPAKVAVNLECIVKFVMGLVMGEVFLMNWFGSVSNCNRCCCLDKPVLLIERATIIYQFLFFLREFAHNAMTSKFLYFCSQSSINAYAMAEYE